MAVICYLSDLITDKALRITVDDSETTQAMSSCSSSYGAEDEAVKNGEDKDSDTMAVLLSAEGDDEVDIELPVQTESSSRACILLFDSLGSGGDKTLFRRIRTWVDCCLFVVVSR